ncbi:hypothetical protein JK636_14595 [Clostridium sp. YIM B02515]|uniref:Uncharacterized protein n=1 Tax=Clostridium rhizosphaerae TaxID=2803861 RepID=A0ABS1TCA9_9CLOT|nr:hypothetical protein [Clostridium rhizosphaerae]MBL4936980.1 hypothetical protein [Clostridium rhizosphaerae]
MNFIISALFLVIGLIFGRLVLNQSYEKYDKNLLIVAAVFFIFGYNTIVFSTSSNFTVILSCVVPPFLVGVVIRRYISKYVISRRNA